MSPQNTVQLGFNLNTLQGLIEVVKAEPETGQTFWEANTSWKKGAGFRSEASIRDFTIGMDEPDVLGGGNSAPNMVEMVLGAYGCCLTTGYVMNASLRGIELEEVKVNVETNLDLNYFFGLKDPASRSPQIRAKVHLVAPKASAEELQTLHKHVNLTSPVGGLLSLPVNVSAELQ